MREFSYRGSWWLEMTRSASASYLSTEFNAFLFAPIGEDSNGMQLSVMSALARLNLDPWREAAELTRLPGDAATQRLASLIGTLPDLPLPHLDLAPIASRLIARLPRLANSNIPPHKTFFDANGVTISRGIIAYAIFVALLLGAEWIIVGGHQPDGNTHAPVSNAISRPVSPPNSNRWTPSALE